MIRSRQPRKRAEFVFGDDTDLAGDVGGSKTLLGLFEPAVTRPVSGAERVFATANYANLIGMIEEFMAAAPASTRIDAACFGVAGPVLEDIARLTNVPWLVDAR